MEFKQRVPHNFVVTDARCTRDLLTITPDGQVILQLRGLLDAIRLVFYLRRTARAQEGMVRLP